MKIVGILLIAFVFVLLFAVISKGMGFKETAILFIIAGILTTILQVGITILAM